jgi:hypothetical protein
VFLGELFSKRSKNGIEEGISRRRWVSDCLCELIWVLFDPINETAQPSPVKLQSFSIFIDSRGQFSKRETVVAGPGLDDQAISGCFDKATEHRKRWITLPVLDTRNRGGGDAGLGSERATRKASVDPSISKNCSTVDHKG